MTRHPRHTTSEPSTKLTHDAAKPLQGSYGSGGSYGVGGGFKDDEPGTRVEAEDEAGDDDARGTSLVADVHTRDSEMNDEYLRDVRRRHQES